MSHSTNAGLEHCDRCSAETTRTPDGECTVCRARDAGRRARQERREAEAHDRARLGLHPAQRATAFVWHALAAAEWWARLGTRSSDGPAVERLERVRRHVAAALQELGR